MSPVAGMRPTTAYFSPPFLCGGCARHFLPCTHHPAPVVLPVRDAFDDWVVGDWQAVLNVFRNRLPESWHPSSVPHPQTFGPLPSFLILLSFFLSFSCGIVTDSCTLQSLSLPRSHSCFFLNEYWRTYCQSHGVTAKGMTVLLTFVFCLFCLTDKSTRTRD